MRLKYYAVALLCLYVFSNCTSQPLAVIYAEDGGDYASSGNEQSNEIQFECDDNSLPEGLCAELKEKFAPDGFWKTENQKALTCITRNCRPGLDSAFSSCTNVGFGQRCEGVEISEQDPQVWSSEIEADPSLDASGSIPAHESGLGFRV